MSEQMRDRRTVTTVRLDPDVRARLDTYAQETRRSINAAINQIISDALDQRHGHRK